jgi:hypothetical protein
MAVKNNDSENTVSENEGLPQIDLSYSGGKGYCPLSELMRAIILRVVDDFRTPGEFRQEAVEYMMDEDEDDEYIFSFFSICKHLGLDPRKTREKIMYGTARISTRRRAA